MEKESVALKDRPLTSSPGLGFGKPDFSAIMGMPVGSGHLSTQSELFSKQAAQMRDTRERSLAGVRWHEVVQEQAAELIVLRKEGEKSRAEFERAALRCHLLTDELSRAHQRVAELEKTRSASHKACRGWRKKFRDAVRLMLKQDRIGKLALDDMAHMWSVSNHVAQDFKDVAVAHQAALQQVVKERDDLQAALVDTTATMNRYFEDWKKAVVLVGDLQGRCDDMARAADGVYRVCKRVDMSFGDMSEIRALLAPFRGLGDAEVDKADRTDGTDRTDRTDGEAAATLRGRLKQVSESLDAEKRGRLAAEGAIEELEGRLKAERRAAELALEKQKERHQSEKDALRGNHANELAGLRSLLAEAERRAWHGALVVLALSGDMDEAELEKVKADCWALMKAEGGSLKAEEGLTTEGTENTEGQIGEGEKAAPSMKVTISPGGLVLGECRTCKKSVFGESYYFNPDSTVTCLACRQAERAAAAAAGEGDINHKEHKERKGENVLAFEVCHRCMRIPDDGIIEMRFGKPYCIACLSQKDADEDRTLDGMGVTV